MICAAGALAERVPSGQSGRVPQRMTVLLTGAAVAVAIAPIGLRAAGNPRPVIVHFSWVLAAVSVAFLMVTIVQQATGRHVTSFSPRSLAVGGYLMAAALALPPLLGYPGMYVAAPLLLSLAVAFICVAWVQPGEDRIVATCNLAIALPILAIWFVINWDQLVSAGAGRVDDYLPQALLSGGAIIVVIAALGVLRWRGKAEAG